MRRFVATCWVPRELSIGPLSVHTISGQCDVTFTPKQALVGTTTLRGSHVTTAIEEPDDTLPDERIYSSVREVALLAINRTICVARLLSKSPLHVLPGLHESEVREFVVGEDGGGSARVLMILTEPPRSAVVARLLDQAEVTATLAPLNLLESPDALWQAALEAACAGRTADAVVGARAALESAWLATAEAAVAAHKSSATPALTVFLDAYYGEATKGTTGIKDRLDRYSKALFGQSFSDRWGADRWSQVTWTFSARNLAAHGAGAVSLDDAFKVVRYIRFALEDIARVRALYP